ncbi:MAG: hypothetical protein IJK06_01160 [Clostridia bacterium]|nr:hypothetical protein [Clostridia bacterium]
MKEKTMNSLKTRRAGIAGRIALAGLISVAVLLVCSKNSPLYPMNDWVDVNCFFTVGRGMRHGLTPYLDLYEQKGPLLYAAYALAAWISETSFIGVFIVEAACFATFLYISGRTAEMLSGTSAAFGWAAAGLGIGVPLSPAFSHGGSAEELFLPVFALAIYLTLKAMKERKPLTARQAFGLGACGAAALWTKYTFCGLFAGLALAVTVWYIADFHGKHLGKAVLQAMAGAGAVTAAVLIRYAVAGALPALWQAYFTDNLTRYSQNIRSGNYDLPLPNLLNNLSWFIPAAAGLLWLLCTVRKRWREVAACVLGAVGLFIFTYASGRRYPYYAIVMATFGAIGFGALFAVIPGKIRDRRAFRYVAAGIVALAVCLGPLAAYHWSGNVYLLGKEKSEMPQYRFAETIREAEDTSLLNYGFLDGGFYYAAESLPVTRWFCTLNNDLPEMKQALKAAVDNGETEFIVTRQQKLKNAGRYELADQAEMVFEGRKWTYYLYRRKAVQETSPP